MTQLHPKHPARRGRIFPELTLSPEKQTRHDVEEKLFDERCRTIFERLRPKLIDKHYNWFMIVEPDSEDYFIDIDDRVVLQKAIEKHPKAIFYTFRINETGICGQI